MRTAGTSNGGENLIAAIESAFDNGWIATARIDRFMLTQIKWRIITLNEKAQNDRVHTSPNKLRRWKVRYFGCTNYVRPDKVVTAFG